LGQDSGYDVSCSEYVTRAQNEQQVKDKGKRNGFIQRLYCSTSHSWRSGTSVTSLMSGGRWLFKKVTSLKNIEYADCARRIVQLKLTTDRHKASRGLSATSQLLVQVAQPCGRREAARCFVSVSS